MTFYALGGCIDLVYLNKCLFLSTQIYSGALNKDISADTWACGGIRYVNKPTVCPQ